MKFRPCIDIHQGKVKQIVGSTLCDSGASENFVASADSAFYARLFRQDGLTGGHIIMLDRSPETEEAALAALQAYPDGMQLGGGINDSNCIRYLAAGASHVIVTSYVFTEGAVDLSRLETLCRLCGRGRVVLDLSCKDPGDGRYRIAADRWQTLTDTEVTADTLCRLSFYCGEFLVHAVDAEGKRRGIDERLAGILSHSPIPVTYAGGIAGPEDIRRIGELGAGKVDFTVGSALDLFGGSMKYEEIKKYHDIHPDTESRY